MPAFTLPAGYSFEPPPDVDVQSIGVPDKGYGGADISQQFDATGIHYVACNAWGPGDPSFRWRAFKRVGAAYVEVPLPFVATGRGEQDVQWYDGKDWGIAWTNDQFQFDIIPGFAAFPSIPALAQRIAELEARLAAIAAALPPLVNAGTLTIPPQLPPREGGEIVLADGEGGEPWHIDVFDGKLRLHRAGHVVQEWE